MRALLMIGCILGTLATSARAAELLKDADKASSWTFTALAPAAGTMTQEQGSLRFDVTKADGTDWRVQAYMALNTLRSKTPYTLRLSAKASSARSLHFNLQLNEGTYIPIPPAIPPAELTTEWKQIAIPLEFDQVDGKSIRVPMFLLGNATGSVWIKDVSLSDGSPANSSPGNPPKPAAPVELLRDPLELKTWNLQLRSGAAASLIKAGEELKVVVERAGTEDGHVEMYATIADLKTPGSYTLTVGMRADAPRKVAFLVTPDTPPYAPVVPAASIRIDTQMRRYRIKFTLKDTPASPIRIPVFRLGDATGTIWFSSMSLTPSDAAGK